MITNRYIARLLIPIGLAAIAIPAHAQPAGNSLASAVFADSMSGMRTLTDQELESSRGGYGGVFFSLLGYVEGSQIGGQLPDGVSIGSQSPDQITLNLGLASLPNTGGFIQFASVVGNNNIVNNNLVLNVYFLDGGVADTSSIANGSALGF